MAEESRQRVARGAALLDEKMPGWWQEGKIDLDTLYMDDSCDCVLGQLGHYAFGLTAGYYDLAAEWGIEGSGREPLSAEYGFWWDEDKTAWTELIEARRIEASEPVPTEPELVGVR